MDLNLANTILPDSEQPKGTIRSVNQALCRIPGRLFNYGTPIFEKNWDVLIVLDACRADLFNEVSDQYEFIDSYNTIYSVASSSLQWMTRNFNHQYENKISETAYVTGNMKSSKKLRGTNEETLHDRPFSLFDEVWRYAWDKEIGFITPKPITDRAIKVYRNQQPDRLIVHYMQPHEPFVPQFLPNISSSEGFRHAYGVGTNERRGVESRPSDYERPWEKLESGKSSYEAVWKQYKQNLQYVLESVRILLSNINAKNVVITSDHGNLLGEWGLYAHPVYVLHPALRRVPWIMTTAKNTAEYEPPKYDLTHEAGPGIEKKLEQLGYK